MKPRCVIQTDGRNIPAYDIHSGIETVTVPWGKSVQDFMKKDSSVLIKSILAPAYHVLSPTPDLGLIRFWHQDRIEFSAPLVSLRNRYHRLMYAQQLNERIRLLIHPTAHVRDLGEEDLRPLKHVIHIPECTTYEIDHVPSKAHPEPDRPEDQNLILEFDYLSIGRNRAILWPPA